MAIGPVEQIFLQARAGQSNDTTLRDSFVSGLNFGLSKQRVDLESAQQEALLTLQQKALDLTIQETGLDIQLKMLNKEHAVQVKRAQSQAGQLMLEASKSPEGFANQAIFEQTSELFKQNPALWGTDIGKSLLNQVQAAMMVQQSQQAIEKARAAGLEQSSQTIKTPTGTVTMEQPALVSTTQTERLLERLRAAQIRGDEQEIQNIMALAGKSGMRLETRPDGSVVFSQGPGSGSEGVTTTTRTRSESVKTSAQNFVGFGNALIRLADPQTVGLLGKGKQLFSEVLGDYVPIDTGDREEFAVATQFFKAEATKLLKSDGSIAESERRGIISDLPSPGWIESSPSVKKKAHAAMQRVAESARRQLKDSGMAVPSVLLKPDEIQTLLDNQLITVEQAQELMLQSPFRELNLK